MVVFYAWVRILKKNPLNSGDAYTECLTYYIILFKRLSCTNKIKLINLCFQRKRRLQTLLKFKKCLGKNLFFNFFLILFFPLNLLEFNFENIKLLLILDCLLLTDDAKNKVFFQNILIGQLNNWMSVLDNYFELY